MLIRYWPLDETGGATVADLVGGWQSQVISDPDDVTAVADGKFGYARDFGAADGGSAHIDLAPVATDTSWLLSEWSLSFWFRRDSTDSAPFWNTLWNIGDYASGETTLWAGIHSSGEFAEVNLHSDGSTQVDSIYVEFDFFGAGWVNILIRSDSTGTVVEVNGIERGSSSSTISLAPQAAGSYFGGESGTSYNDSMADDLALFDHVLSAEEAETLWSGGDGTPASEFLPGPAPILQAPEMALQVYPPAAQSPIGAPRGSVLVDWAMLLDPLTTRIYYALELDDGVLDPVRLPMTSWQATLQLDRSSYVQAVVPNAGEHLAAITARDGGEIRILRGARFEDGSTQEVQIASAPLQRPRSDEGPTNHTMTLSGYAQLTPPDGASDRVLQDIRTISTDNGIRARCGLDWWLRPGQMANARGASFEVAYLNYYVTVEDEYMDVGERPL